MPKFFSYLKSVKKQGVIPVKKIDNTLTIEITLTPENVAALLDYKFWTGTAVNSSLINKILQEWMEGTGESLMWYIANDPKMKVEAFRRNKLSDEEIANFNAGLDAARAKSNVEIAGINVDLFKSQAKEKVKAISKVEWLSA